MHVLVMCNSVVPKPSGTSSRDGEFGLPIYLLVGFLTLLPGIALNIALTGKPSNLFPQKPNPYASLFPSRYLTTLHVCQPFSTLPPFLLVRLNLINHLAGFIPCQIFLYFSN